MDANRHDVAKTSRLHHIGFVVHSIAASVRSFVDSMHADWDETTYEDPLQDARVTFLRPALAASPELELVEPMSEHSPVHRFLAAGGKLHHICYEVPDLNQTLNSLNPKETLVIRAPLPAVAFGGRSIAWVSTRQGLIIEYLQAAILDSPQ
jgi:methylmalonyl-CoA/ethylmalonyl-CoA epimerase